MGALPRLRSRAFAIGEYRLMSTKPTGGVAGATSGAWPTELRLQKDRRTLVVSFDDGQSFALPAEYLRVRSPSAEVQGHSPAERRTVAGKRDVMILELHPVGNYAVRIIFDDTHSTGIFSWDYLFELGHNRDRYWRDYLDELAGKNLSRAPTAH
jgi:DUF971 family protein